MKEFFEKIKSISAKCCAWLKKTVGKAKSLADKLCPVAIQVVDTIKEVNDSTTGDAIEFIVSSAIPGTKDDIIIASARKFLKEYLPKFALELKIINSAADAKDESELLKQICAGINGMSDDIKGQIYHTLACKFIELGSDGKFTWSDAVALAECYFLEKKNG